MYFVLLIFMLTGNVFGNGVLDDILEKVNKTNKSVVIFDLDDTLFYSSSRSLVIFKEFYQKPEYQSAFPYEISRLKEIKFEQVEYSIEDTLENAQIYNAKFISILKSFWLKRFFKNEYVLEDTVVEGSVQYVSRLAKTGAKIVYLTGRDNSMRSGTLRALAGAGFPIDGVNHILITKEKFEIPDIEYKKKAFKQIEKYGKIIAFFENEPENLNAMIDYFKCGTAVFLDIKHSPTNVEPSGESYRVKNYLY